MKKKIIAFLLTFISLISFSEIRKSSQAVSSIMNLNNKSLPEGIIAVQYIGQIDNKQYINTYVVPPAESILKCEFQFTTLVDQLNIIGINYNGFGFGISGGMFRINCFDYITLSDAPDQKWHVWTIDEIKMVGSLDDISIPIKRKHVNFSDDWDGSCGFSLFRRVRASNGYSDLNTYRARCRYLSIKTVDCILLDAIAVRFINENGENEGALFDRVSRTLLRNNGSGYLEIGPDI